MKMSKLSKEIAKMYGVVAEPVQPTGSIDDKLNDIIQRLERIEMLFHSATKKVTLQEYMPLVNRPLTHPMRNGGDYHIPNRPKMERKIRGKIPRAESR